MRCGCMGRRPRRRIAMRRWRGVAIAYLRAEGYWGLEQYEEAKEQFRDCDRAAGGSGDVAGAVGDAVARAVQ